jgi:outer membrane protein assembly factor BamE
MRRLVILSSNIALALILATTGCARSEKPDRPSGSMLSNLPFVYKMTVQQGNILTESMVNQLELGMNRSQVQYLLGTPLLTDMFHRDRWDYIYTIRRGHNQMESTRLTLWFQDDQLSSVEGFAQPDPDAALAALEEETLVVEVPNWQDDRGIITRTLNAVGLETEE